MPMNDPSGIDLSKLPRGRMKRATLTTGQGRLHMVIPRALITRIQREAASEQVSVSDWCARVLESSCRL